MERQLGLLSKYYAGMTDLNFSHNPLSQECIFIVNDIEYDQYQDAVKVERCRVKKRCLVKKNPDMYYVQEFNDELIEDTDEIPWIVSITITDLKEKPKASDQILINGLKYTISKVKPINRNVEAVFNCLVYPERYEEDDLALYEVTYCNGVLSFVWGGNPTEIALDEDAVSIKERRFKFESFMRVNTRPNKVWVFDKEDNCVNYDL